jgi:pyruvate formate lyase activating enzyme
MSKLCHPKLWEKLPKNKVRCIACAHRCLIQSNRRGICGVRENTKGKLYSLVYGKAIAVNIDPIEKKPFFHFLPGTKSLSLATVGCNFRCNNCQNWSISQSPKIGTQEVYGENWPPSKVLKMAMDNNCQSISYTYTEPTVFVEYALDTMKLAKKYKLKNTWVSNGYMTLECVKVIAPYLNAANIDLKSFSDKFYRANCGGTLKPVLESLKLLKAKKIWVEITTLVIPGLSDNMEMLEKMANWIRKELGAETPWHISQFFPAYKLPHLNFTPAETINEICKMGRAEGLKYVYSGNIPSSYYEDTYCPKCNQMMIDRELYSIMRFDKNGKCRNCGEDLNLIL